MAKALGAEVVTVDFKNENVTTVIHEAVPQGLDGELAPSCSPIRELSETPADPPSVYRLDHFPRAKDTLAQGRKGFDARD